MNDYSQTLEMLKKFKPKLFSARGAFEGEGADNDGGDGSEEKAPPTTAAAEDEMGMAESHDLQGVVSKDALKWYTDHARVFTLVMI